MQTDKPISHVILLPAGIPDAQVMRTLVRDAADELVVVSHDLELLEYLERRCRTLPLQRRTRIVKPDQLLIGPFARPGQLLNLAFRCCSNPIICVSDGYHQLTAQGVLDMEEELEPLGNGSVLLTDVSAKIVESNVETKINAKSLVGGMCVASMATYHRLQFFDEYRMDPRMCVPSMVARALFVPYREGLKVKTSATSGMELEDASLRIKHSRVNHGRELFDDLPCGVLRAFEVVTPEGHKPLHTTLTIGTLWKN